MWGYMIEKLEHLWLAAVGPVYHLVLAYLLQETHLLADTTLLGTTADYLVL